MNVTACNKQAEGHFIRQEGRELAADTDSASVRKESHRPKANTGSNILRQKMGQRFKLPARCQCSHRPKLSISDN